VCTKVLKKAAKKAKKLFHLTIELIKFEVTVVSVPFQTFYGQMKQTKELFSSKHVWLAF